MKPLNVVREHECDTLAKYDTCLSQDYIAVQKFDDGRWYWVRGGKNRTVADGIKYCPYCGKNLFEEENV